jgi:hypothetical protein
MADTKPSTNSYRMLGGVNEKASEYSVEKAQFLNLRNVDFQVPNALQKRPGSSEGVGTGTSGPISSIFEFEKLDGSSWIVAGSNTALFYLAANSYTLLSSGWSNGQPADMLAFVNKLWVANGQKFEWWNGSTMQQAGLPCPRHNIEIATHDNNGASFFLVGGETHLCFISGSTFLYRGVFVAYSYIRNDGYFGPLDFAVYPRNVVNTVPATSGEEFFSTLAARDVFGGITIPSGMGISGIAIWVATDYVSNTEEGTSTAGRNPTKNNMGYVSGGIGTDMLAFSLLPDVTQSRFHLFTTVPGASLFPQSLSGTTMWTTTFMPTSLASFALAPTGDRAFSGVPFCWFDSNIPKYIEVNQNVMFMAGFSPQPSVAWFSEVGAPESTRANYNFEVRTNDGDKILATKAFQNGLLIMKERSFHKVIGDNPDNYQLVEMSSQYGCISNKTVVEFREMLAWLDRQGVLQYNGSAWEVISTPIEDTFRRMNLSAAREKACAVHYPFRNQLWFGIPVDGSTENNLTVVYDYLVGAWTFFDGFNASSFALAKGALNTPTAWRGDYSGKVHYFGESFYGDNGQGITCLGFSPFERNKENETWIWRRLFLDVAPVTGLTGVINCQLFANYNRSTVQATFAIYQDQFQSRADFGVVAKGTAVQFSHHSASLPLLINGYSWTKRYLRNV